MNIVECFLSLSRSLDFTHQGLMRHHYRTTLIAARLAKAVGLDSEDFLQLFQAALIHDIGVISWQEKQVLTTFEIDNPWEHCQRGYNLLIHNSSLNHLASIILNHHNCWSGDNPSGLNKNQIPLASRIIHLADRVDVLINQNHTILDQGSIIIDTIRKHSGLVFDPDLVALLEDLARRDSFWLDLVSPWEKECINIVAPFHHTPMESDYLLDIARLFAQVVDAKSPFTYRHSRGVARVAKYIGKQLGKSDEECALLEVAGLLHDLGKLSVPTKILEKPGRLTTSEFNVIKQHAYYTYWLLKPVTKAFPLAEWAAFHHEKLNGKGYPFGKTREDLDLNARLITLADVFVALREERPYRPGMDWNQIAKIMNELIITEALDNKLTSLLLDNQKPLDLVWTELVSDSDTA